MICHFPQSISLDAECFKVPICIVDAFFIQEEDDVVMPNICLPKINEIQHIENASSFSSTFLLFCYTNPFSVILHLLRFSFSLHHFGDLMFLGICSWT